MERSDRIEPLCDDARLLRWRASLVAEQMVRNLHQLRQLMAECATLQAWARELRAGRSERHGTDRRRRQTE